MLPLAPCVCGCPPRIAGRSARPPCHRDACDHVSGAAGGEGQDELHRPVRPGLGMGIGRDGGKAEASRVSSRGMRSNAMADGRRAGYRPSPSRVGAGPCGGRSSVTERARRCGPLGIALDVARTNCSDASAECSTLPSPKSEALDASHCAGSRSRPGSRRPPPPQRVRVGRAVGSMKNDVRPLAGTVASQSKVGAALRIRSSTRARGAHRSSVMPDGAHLEHHRTSGRSDPCGSLRGGSSGNPAGTGGARSSATAAGTARGWDRGARQSI